MADEDRGPLAILGLDPGTELVYDVLVRMPQATRAGLARAAGTSPARAGRALGRLVSLGVARRVAGSPARYRAVDPGIALDVLLLEREEQVKHARIRAEELSERFHQAVAGGDPSKLVEIVTGRSAVIDRVQQVSRSAHHQLRAMDRPPYAHDPRTPNPAAVAALARRLTVRIIFHPEALQVPGRLEQLATDARAGEQHRVLGWLPVKMLLVDDRLAMTPLLTGPGQIESMAIVQRSSLLAALSSYFETLWGLAAPLDLTGGAPDRQPDTVAPRLLALMVAGLPDDVIARQLGLSPRTLQRRLHALMAAFHAQTRFQLAVQAVRHGLIDPARHPAPRPATSNPSVAGEPRQ